MVGVSVAVVVLVVAVTAAACLCNGEVQLSFETLFNSRCKGKIKKGEFYFISEAIMATLKRATHGVYKIWTLLMAFIACCAVVIL